MEGVALFTSRCNLKLAVGTFKPSTECPVRLVSAAVERRWFWSNRKTTPTLNYAQSMTSSFTKEPLIMISQIELGDSWVKSFPALATLFVDLNLEFRSQIESSFYPVSFAARSPDNRWVGILYSRNFILQAFQSPTYKQCMICYCSHDESKCCQCCKYKNVVHVSPI